MAEDLPQEPQQTDNQPVFGIEKIYVKDLSLEIPNAPQVFQIRETPQVSIELHHSGGVLSEGIYETVVTVTVTAKHDDKTVFLVEVAQAGIFQIRNVPSDSIEPILSVTCPNILFPYAREVVSDMVTVSYTHLTLPTILRV